MSHSSPLLHEVVLIELPCVDNEVQGFYQDGMRVPDDVVLLWADDKYVGLMVMHRFMLII